MKTFGKKILAICILGTMALFAYGVCAAEINTFDSEFSVKITPSNPAPGTPVTAEIVSYQFDVDRSVITWVLNNKEIAKGIGKRKIEFTVPSFGSNVVMDVLIITDKGLEVSKKINFSGNDIDILWEAGTNVPEWYMGKALPVKKSYVRFVAIPHIFSEGKEFDPSTLIYEWSIKYKKVPKASGFNVRSMSLKLNDFGEYVVGVKVTDKSKKIDQEKVIKISAQDIKEDFVFYEENLLKGTMFGSALKKNFDIASKNISIKAEPYNFIPDLSSLTYRWIMNGKEVENDGVTGIINLKTPESSGSANLSLKVSYGFADIFQSVEKSLRVKF